MFAERCKALRKRKGLSQEQLAEQCGVSRQTVSKWESGCMMPEIDKLLRISEYFEVTLDDLLKENSMELSKPVTPPNTVFSFEKVCEMLLPRRNKMEILYRDSALYDLIHDDQRNEKIRGFWHNGGSLSTLI